MVGLRVGGVLLEVLKSKYFKTLGGLVYDRGLCIFQQMQCTKTQHGRKGRRRNITGGKKTISQVDESFRLITAGFPGPL
jgi:hypothetical protein